MTTKRLYLYFFIISLFTGLGAYIGYYVASSNYSDMETRLQTLETGYKSSLRAGQEIKMDEVKILIDKSAEEVKKGCWLLTYVGFPLTIIALLISIYQAYKWSVEMAKEEIKNILKDPYTLLKENKHILVLTPRGDSEGFEWIQRFFVGMGFKNTNFEYLENFKEHKGGKYDLIFLNIGGENNCQQEIDDLAKLYPRSMLFYFGTSRVKHPELDKAGRLSYANTRAQIYGNLMNALNFHKVL